MRNFNYLSTIEGVSPAVEGIQEATKKWVPSDSDPDVEDCRWSSETNENRYLTRHIGKRKTH